MPYCIYSKDKKPLQVYDFYEDAAEAVLDIEGAYMVEITDEEAEYIENDISDYKYFKNNYGEDEDDLDFERSWGPKDDDIETDELEEDLADSDAEPVWLVQYYEGQGTDKQIKGFDAFYDYVAIADEGIKIQNIWPDTGNKEFDAKLPYWTEEEGLKNDDDDHDYYDDFYSDFDNNEEEDDDIFIDDTDESLKEYYNQEDDYPKETFTPEEQEEYGIDEEGIDESGEQWIHCQWCEDVVPISNCRRELNLGWICDRCQSSLFSRGERAAYYEAKDIKKFTKAEKELNEGIIFSDKAIRCQVKDLLNDPLGKLILSRLQAGRVGNGPYRLSDEELEILKDEYIYYEDDGDCYYARFEKPTNEIRKILNLSPQSDNPFIADKESYTEDLDKNKLPKVGDTIRIIHLKDEDNRYDGRVGEVESIDDIGQLHGTWGGLAIIPEEDEFEIVTTDNESLEESKQLNEDARYVGDYRGFSIYKEVGGGYWAQKGYSDDVFDEEFESKADIKKAIDDLINSSGRRGLYDRFGESLIEDINPETGFDENSNYEVRSCFYDENKENEYHEFENFDDAVEEVKKQLARTDEVDEVVLWDIKEEDAIFGISSKEKFMTAPCGPGASGDIWYIGYNEADACNFVDQAYPDWTRYGLSGDDTFPYALKLTLNATLNELQLFDDIARELENVDINNKDAYYKAMDNVLNKYNDEIRYLKLFDENSGSWEIIYDASELRHEAEDESNYSIYVKYKDNTEEYFDFDDLDDAKTKMDTLRKNNKVEFANLMNNYEEEIIDSINESLTEDTDDDWADLDNWVDFP